MAVFAKTADPTPLATSWRNPRRVCAVRDLAAMTVDPSVAGLNRCLTVGQLKTAALDFG
jgi:hypothetical protein